MPRRPSSRDVRRATPADGKTRTREPERRQLTIMFCDLVESTALSHRIDPEDMREVLRLFQGTCAGIIERYEGYVSRYMGDAILVLFGYPSAHEDDAERAVHAALDITKAVSSLKAPHDSKVPLAVRTGIATGLVVAGDVIGEGSSEEEAIVGSTPNLAARLQSLAEPNAVVIADDTRRLLRDAFDYRCLGEHALKGFDAPVTSWRVVGQSAVETRFEAAQDAGLTPLVNRMPEIEQLRRLWREARTGSGRVLLLSGEAGIGKSRLAKALRDEIAAEPHARLQFQCSPFHRYTALYPFTRHLERAAGFERDDPDTLKLEKLARVLSEETVPLFASLLSIPTDRDEEIAEWNPRRRKELIFRAILGNISAIAEEKPVLATVEDVHWMDPTSLELMSLIIDSIAGSRALFIITFRPEFEPQWNDRPHAAALKLDGLAAPDCEALVQNVLGDARPSRRVIAQVVDRTEGVPLFIEELVKSLVGSGLIGKSDQGAEASGEPFPGTIPATLNDSLMARIDQLGEAKSVAQIGAAIGQEFTQSLLESVAMLGGSELGSSLETLVESELVLRRVTANETRYAFKHALVRDAAYNSLLRRRREELHRRIAECLEKEFPEARTKEPELLAQHYMEARLHDEAIDYWLEAGRQAGRRSANAEAVVHLSKGIDVLQGLPATAGNEARELDFLVLLGPALMSTRGPGTADVARVYERALELCGRLPESEDHFNVHWGWWRVSMNHEIGRGRADRLLELGASLGDPGLQLQAHHCQWATLFHLGEHAGCCRHVDSALALYDPERHRHQAALYGGHDAKVCGLGEKALSLWLQGYPDSAFESLSAALDWAQSLGHVGSLAHAKDYQLILNIYCRYHQRVSELADAMAAFSRAQGLPDYDARARFFHGWAASNGGQSDESLAEMTGALEALVDIGTKEDFPMFFDLMAQVRSRRGQFEEGLDLIERAFQESRAAGLQFWLAELHRCRAVLQIKSGAGEAETERDLDAALGIASAQGARAFELRAAVTLAQLRQQQGRAADGRAVLDSVYQRFDQGLDTPDLAEAKRLLQALS